MPTDPGEGVGKLAELGEPDVPVLADGADPEGGDDELDELPAELDDGELLLEGELLDEELLGADIIGGMETDGIDGVVGMLALGQPVSATTAAAIQQPRTTR